MEKKEYTYICECYPVDLYNQLTDADSMKKK